MATTREGCKSALARNVKNLLGSAVDAIGLGRRLFAGCAMVVGFHRVTDSVPEDDMSLSTGSFAAYCRYFKNNFDVISLGALVDKLNGGKRLSGQLVISLDDGYADNHSVAAPILESYDLPATFFLTTDLIGADTVPWWDEKSPVRHPFMTWDQARDLQKRGFELGAHTATHQDLGRVPLDVARRELVSARETMKRELGTAPTLFAYPYGRLDAITPQARELVAATGYRCCCAGAGGLNTTGADPMSIRRYLISGWHRRPEHFLGHVLVERLRGLLRR